MSRRHGKSKGRRRFSPARELEGIIRRVDAGSGFFIPDDTSEDDLYIKGRNLNGALDKDRVRAHMVKPAQPGRRADGCVTEILERGMTRVIGDLRRHSTFYYILPMGARFYETITVELADIGGAREGDRVAADIVSYGPLRATVTDILGPSGSPDVEMKTVKARHEVPSEFSREVTREASGVPDHVLKSDLAGRTDLRHLPILTIDPIDARDLDDAISFERRDDGRLRVGVHIADVSHYVRPGTALDDEAARRATSIYLVDGVIPMLPPGLSNGICSLNAGEDRLALSAFLDYTPDGRSIGASFCRSVIRVTRRFHYDEIDEILASARYPDRFEFMPDLAGLARQIRARRSDRGSIDFDFPEVKLVLDDTGKVTDVRVLTHTISHQLIEEYMIGANESVADYLTSKKLPMIYRVHAKPEEAKLLALEQFLFNLGIKVRVMARGKGAPAEKARGVSKRLQALLAEVKSGPWDRVVNYQLLRSMPKAIYSSSNIGHFGLGSECYCHFTSPIRRYPDLTVHRMLADVIEGREPAKSELKKIETLLSQTARHSTEMEIKAMEAERESVKVKLLEVMQSKVGQVMTATISGVVSFGMFVQLPNTVEGLVHVSTLRDDHYEVSEVTASLIGRRTGKRYRIGDEIRVRVERVDLPMRQLDLTVV